MSVLYDTVRQSDIFLKRMFGAVDHHRRKSAVHTGFTYLKILTVVEMEANRQIGIRQGGFHQFDQVNVFGVFARSGGNLKYKRGFFLFGCVDYTLNDFHVVDVESAYGVLSFIGFFEHFGRRY
jgi:hypothetical protein